MEKLTYKNLKGKMMENKIIQIISEVCDSGLIKENKNIDLLENDLIDSLAFITLIQRLEEEFNVEIQPTQETPDAWRTVDSIIELVKRYQNEKKKREKSTINTYRSLYNSNSNSIPITSRLHADSLKF